MNRGRHFANALRVVAQDYMRQVHAFERAMERGDSERADNALSEMRAIEARVTIIETKPAKGVRL